MSLGVVRAIRDLGLTIPGDVSLIAHDDVFPWLKPENFSVPLSTTRSSIRAAGQRIAERLAARISGLESGPRGEIWPVDLVVRGSIAGALRNSRETPAYLTASAAAASSRPKPKSISRPASPRSLAVAESAALRSSRRSGLAGVWIRLAIAPDNDRRGEGRSGDEVRAAADRRDHVDAGRRDEDVGAAIGLLHQLVLLVGGGHRDDTVIGGGIAVGRLRSVVAGSGDEHDVAAARAAGAGGFEQIILGPTKLMLMMRTSWPAAQSSAVRMVSMVDLPPSKARA